MQGQCSDFRRSISGRVSSRTLRIPYFHGRLLAPQVFDPSSCKSGRRSQIDPEQGVALLELAVVIPIFVIILFFMISLGPFLNVYLSTAHLAHEGTRMLSSKPELDVTTTDRYITVWQPVGGTLTACHSEHDMTGTAFPSCDAVLGTIPDTHREVHERMRTLIEVIGIQNFFVGGEVGVISSHNDTSDNVVFTIYGSYQGWARLLLGRVVVTEEGPYLY